MLRLCRERLDEAGKERNRHFLLTITAGAFNEYVQNTQMDKLHEYVDFINLMTYDMYESECDSITGHHAPLYTNPRDPKKLSVDSIVKTYLYLGVPQHKIVLGIPFYGRTWQNAGPQYYGLYVPGDVCEKHIRTSHVYLKPHLENK